MNGFKHCQLFFIALIFFQCSSPYNYINNVPLASNLQEKGDANLAVNYGADARLTSMILDWNASWAPVDHFGITAQATTKVYSMMVNELSAQQIGFVYFNQFEKMGFETVIGYGRGRINSGDFPPPPNDYFTPSIPQIHAYTEANYNKLFLQPSLYFRLPDDPHLSIYAGIKTDFVHFNHYYVSYNDEWTFEGTFPTIVSTPFIQGRFKKGHFGWNTTLAYSHHLMGEQNTNDVTHPFHRRLFMSFGLNLFLKND